MRTQSESRGTAASAMVALVGLAVAAPAHAQWPSYTVERIGLQGPEYVGSLGQRTDTFKDVLPQGIAIGQTARLAPGVSGTGAWVWSEDDGTRQIGLVGPEYTSANRAQVANIEFVNAHGMVAGTSQRPINAAGDYGLDVWLWNGSSTMQLGFIGSAYTFDVGSRMSFLFDLADSGVVAGTSMTTIADFFGYGRDAWIWRNGEQHEVGLTGPAYTTPSGYRFAQLLFLNEDGQLVGYTERRNELNWFLGQDTWVSSGPTTRQIGLVGGIYLKSNGTQFSSATKQSEAGHVLGYSRRFDDQGDQAGQDAWVYDGTTTRQVGLTGGVYTGLSGYQSSIPAGVNSAGMAVGSSNIYIDQDTEYGYDAWYWDAATTRRIGLVGPEYQGTNGFRRSIPNRLLDDGRAAGLSWRIVGDTTLNGMDAWVFDGVSTRLAGLVGSGYETAGGKRASSFLALNEQGSEIAGYTTRYTPDGTANGFDVWVWTDSGARLASLAGPEHTGSAGYRLSSVVHFQSNEHGQLRGTTKRITGVNTDNGQDVWWWDGSTTHQLGLTGPEYVSPSGYASSTVSLQNAANQAAGTSTRFRSDGTSAGSVAWYFDPATNQNHAIVASIGPIGAASSAGHFLTDDGFLIGTYTFYPNGTTPSQSRGFIYRPDRGFADLGELTEGGMSDWSRLSAFSGAVSDQLIFGTGATADQPSSQITFVLRAIGDDACPACAADYDQDGGVTGGDIGAFFADFETGDSCADVDFDGGITGGDLGAFFVVFEAGGC